MTEDVPAPGEEGLVGDGVERSAVDDAEGFPGGPRDLSVLTLFAEHVAHSIWNGEKRPKLKLVSYERKGVISAFVKRWHKETSSFHLPVEELTITLDDVASLLHLPIIGTFHSFEPLHVDEVVIMLVELLEVSGEEARTETTQCHGAYVCLSWLRDIYQRRCEARQWIVAARAYLLHLVGCTLFVNKSATHVHVVHLDAFRDLAQSGSYAWELPRCVTDDGYDETLPRAYRWFTTKAYMKGLTASLYRTCIDALTIIDCSGDYMEWFFEISHLFITPTQATDQPKHPPVPQHEIYVEPDISEVPVAAGVGPSQDACEAIAERLECVLNLRMVTEGTKLHDIMEDCLRIARGVTLNENVYVRARRR
ncbi:uncharacterized protein LOC114417313 [Glycine soja]|uniref:uncharacterized protein LOC114417313 n=1 Tax=Glycine soja TaxID=3848 RepID=UPI00103DCA8D|nr:uncharacterized protein LOC114417313 [Glycine soja]